MKPNLIYIFADQWRAEAMGCMKEDQVSTPNMDGFAEEGIRFLHAYSTYPLCSPHRASLLTGKYPFSCGVWTNCKIGLEEKVMLRPQEICISDVLKEEGYHTGYIGKWHLDAPEQNFVREPKSGACDWDAFTPPGERRHGFDYWLSYGTYDAHLDPHYWQDTPRQIKPGKWSVEYETDKALDYLETYGKADHPFALFVSYNPPHSPYDQVPDCYYEQVKDLEIQWRANVPENMRTEEMAVTVRQYFAAVEGIDHQFGRILQHLKDHGLEENTIVVLSADHGDMMGSQGLMGKNVWFHEALHIPLIIRQKGRIQPGVREGIFASPDHMPTLLELLGLPVPETCQGFSHAKAMEEKIEEEPDHMFICGYPCGAGTVDNFNRRGLTHKAYGWRGIKTKRYTYIVDNTCNPDGEQTRYLYDHAIDPYECSPAIIKRDCKEPLIQKFQEYLIEYLEIQGDPFLL
jgi:uncharacterized sulfatase